MTAATAATEAAKATIPAIIETKIFRAAYYQRRGFYILTEKLPFFRH